MPQYIFTESCREAKLIIFVFVFCSADFIDIAIHHALTRTIDMGAKLGKGGCLIAALNGIDKTRMFRQRIGRHSLDHLH